MGGEYYCGNLLWQSCRTIYPSNMYWRFYRDDYNWYLNEYLPQQSEARRQSEMYKAYKIHVPMSCAPTLETFWNNNLW